MAAVNHGFVIRDFDYSRPILKRTSKTPVCVVICDLLFAALLFTFKTLELKGVARNFLRGV